MDLGFYFGEPWGSLLGSFERQSLKMERVCCFVPCFVGASKKGLSEVMANLKTHVGKRQGGTPAIFIFVAL